MPCQKEPDWRLATSSSIISSYVYKKYRKVKDNYKQTTRNDELKENSTKGTPFILKNN